jgi:hypothetical protein
LAGFHQTARHFEAALTVNDVNPAGTRQDINRPNEQKQPGSQPTRTGFHKKQS